MSISVKNITKLYGEQKALDQVSFEVKSGEIVGFLGPNGAGKSTMMKILTGYIPQTSGTARVNGFDIINESMEVRRNVGYLPENNPLYGDMYVEEYLRFAAGMQGRHSSAGALARKMIDLTGLGLERKKKIRMLSKGYRQRVGLAQALIHDPKVLILDEPTSGLDPNQLAEIRNLIKEIGKAKTVMLSTHIMQEVKALCQRVIIIDRGKIVANEAVENIQNVMKQQAEYYEVEFDKAMPAEELQKIEGILNVKNSKGNTWMIEAVKDHDIRADIFRLAVKLNLAVLTMKKSETSLEDIFREVTGKK